MTLLANPIRQRDSRIKRSIESPHQMGAESGHVVVILNITRKQKVFTFTNRCMFCSIFVTTVKLVNAHVVPIMNIEIYSSAYNLTANLQKRLRLIALSKSRQLNLYSVNPEMNERSVPSPYEDTRENPPSRRHVT